MHSLPKPNRTAGLLFVSYLLFCSGSKIMAQQGDTLLGVQFISDGIFSTLNIQTDSITNVNNLNNPPLFLQGQCTYDRINHRYFIKGTGIFGIDATTGNYTDTLTGITALNNFEYDERANAIVGPEIMSSANFISIDLLTKTTTTLGSIQASGIFWSESTFDRVNRRYFFNSMAGVNIIDSTGSLVDILPKIMNGIEYDPGMNVIFGTYWDGTNHIFTSVDVSTKSVNDLAALQGIQTLFAGENTYDETTHRYFAKTTQGIAVIDALSGNVLGMLDPAQYLTCIEYANYAEPSVPVNTTGIHKINATKNTQVYPNPANGKFNFSNLPEGSQLEVSDMSGRIIRKQTFTKSQSELNLEGETKGIYTYKIISGNREVLLGKLILN